MTSIIFSEKIRFCAEAFHSGKNFEPDLLFDRDMHSPALTFFCFSFFSYPDLRTYACHRQTYRDWEAHRYHLRAPMRYATPSPRRPPLHGTCTRSPAWVLHAWRPPARPPPCTSCPLLVAWPRPGQPNRARPGARRVALLSLPASHSLPLPASPRAVENIPGTSPPRGLLRLCSTPPPTSSFEPGAAARYPGPASRKFQP